MDPAISKDEKECREAMRYYWLGMEFAIIFVGFAGCGVWLDHKLGTLPGFTALLGVVGLLTAMYRVVKDAMTYRRWLEEQKLKHSESDSGDESGDASQ